MHRSALTQRTIGKISRRFRRPLFGLVQMLALLASLFPSGSLVLADEVTYTLTIGAASGVNINGTTAVTAHMVGFDGSDYFAVEGQALSFSVGGGGSIDNFNVTTDSGGNASVSFTGGSSDSTITVSGGGLTASCTITAIPDVYELHIQPDKTNVPPGQTTVIRAAVFNVTQNQQVTGTNLKFAKLGGDGTLGPSTFIDANGNCVISYTSGTQATVVKVDGYNDLTKSCTITATEDTYSLSLTSDINPLSPGQQTTVHARFYDETIEEGVPGIVLNFSVATGDGKGTIDTASGITGPDGYVDLTYTSGWSDTQINAWDATGYQQSTSGVMNVNTNAVTDHAMWGAAVKNPLQQNETTDLCFWLSDLMSDNPVGGATIYFRVASGNAQLGALSATTQSDGSFTIPVTAGTANSTIILWESRPGAVSATYGLTLSVPSSGDDLSALILAPAALGEGQSTVPTLQAWDSTVGLPVLGGVEIDLDLSGLGQGASCNEHTGGILTLATSTDTGMVDVSLVGGSTPSVLRARLHDQPDSAWQSVTIGLPPHYYALTTGADRSVLLPSESATLWAQLWDTTLDQPVTGATINFTRGSGDDVGTSNGLSSPSATTDSNGLCTVTYTGGSYTTSIIVADGSGYHTTQSYTFGVKTVDPSYSINVWSDNNTLLAGDSAPLYVQVWDNTTGLVAGGVTVSFSVTTGNGTLQVGTATTDSTGNCTGWFTGGSSPSSVSVGTSYATAPANYDFAVAQAYQALGLSADVYSLHANETATITVHAANMPYGTPADGLGVYLEILGGDGQLLDANPYHYQYTNSSGDCTFPFQGGINATTLRARDTNGAIYSGEITINYLSGGGDGGDGPPTPSPSSP